MKDELTWAARFDSTGTKVFTSTNKGKVRLWDVASAKELKVVAPGKADVAIDVLAPSDDGKTLFAAGAESVIHVLDAETLASKGSPLIGHTAEIRALVANGNRLASIQTEGTDTTLRLWDVAAAKETQHARIPGWVGRLAFSPDGRFLVAIGDTTVTVLDGQTLGIVKRIGDLDAGGLRGDVRARRQAALHRLRKRRTWASSIRARGSGSSRSTARTTSGPRSRPTATSTRRPVGEGSCSGVSATTGSAICGVATTSPASSPPRSRRFSGFARIACTRASQALSASTLLFASFFRASSASRFRLLGRVALRRARRVLLGDRLHLALRGGRVLLRRPTPHRARPSLVQRLLRDPGLLESRGGAPIFLVAQLALSPRLAASRS